MRYYIETIVEDKSEYIIIKPKTEDFEEFLQFKLSQFPQYIAPVTNRKWLKRKVQPDILSMRVAGAEIIEINKPIYINYIGIKNCSAYREELLDLLMEWLSDCTDEFQLHWKSMTVTM
ncbi:hypothetical protein [Planomicrobium okeanokoites]|uniref:hypothetical protein n=1 Tax=Planomicrobium okeanokoites TaxID=244 RepID=UPI00248F871F|nr:hypothetical protein [Planomicrobium okeanokoites]